MNICENPVGTSAREALEARKKTGRTQQLPGFVNMGATLLLAVFLVITLVVFALLALSGSRNDLEFSRQLADQRTQYYNACSRSEEILAQVDQAFLQAEKQGTEPDLSGLELTIEENRVCWEVSVDENRVLQAAYCPQTGEITCWKVVSLQNWDDEQPIWNP